MKVIGYIRVSTEEQHHSGLGLSDQEAKVRQYCELYGLELVEIVQDAASGKNLNRSGLQSALASLQNGDAEGLVVAKLDRLTRSVKDMGALLDSYFRERAELFVVAEQIDTRTASGRFVLNLLTSVAEWERETISERTKAALAQKKAKGQKVGGVVPFGFRVGEDNTLVKDSTETAVYERICQLREDKLSYAKIAEVLNGEGIPTKTGKVWSYGTVANICKRAA